MYSFRMSNIQWSMDRIIYFRMVKGRKDMPTYKVNVFRKEDGTFLLYYIQLSGTVSLENMKDVQGEMYKAYDRIQSRFKNREEIIHTYMVYEESFSHWLADMGDEGQWQEFWRLPLYYDYHSVENLQYILKQIPRQNFPHKAYVLGCGVGINEWLPLIADQVMQIEFYLEFVTKSFERLQQQLCEEYGMLTQVKLVDRGEYTKVRLSSEEPVLIVDFSGRVPISTWGLKKGSIWIDMDSVENKRHFIEDRPTGLQYYSLKTIWGREIAQPLDIISKFAYNTEVKKGKL